MNNLKNIFSLKDKIALVTGSGRGNGKAIVEAFATYGAKVIALDILPFAEYESKNVEYFHCDITEEQEVTSIIDKVLKKYKKIDILVNNAGVSFPKSFLEYSDEDWEKTYKVNLKAPYNLIKKLALSMKDNNGGSIINITSLNSELAFPNNPAYVSMKGALKQLTKSAALDLGKYNIRVNNIGPGYIMTDMTKGSWSNPAKHKQRADKTVLGRWGKPEDLVGAAVFLASSASSYVTGQDIYVDGGWLIKGL
jgi:NAD(P)-dependent dehydrogenase (short-subunit alcohol dehydrogenase family)